LRPEFRLTPLGIKAAALANKIQGVTTKADQETLRLSWTLPVLTTLYHAQHFNQIKCHLNPVSDRALSKMLILLGDKNWVRRSVDDTARPPRSQYRVVNKGRNICYTIAPHISFA
jgi:DNA-binding HxlR family transcriptional regulator